MPDEFRIHRYVMRVSNCEVPLLGPLVPTFRVVSTHGLAPLHRARCFGVVGLDQGSRRLQSRQHILSLRDISQQDLDRLGNALVAHQAAFMPLRRRTRI